MAPVPSEVVVPYQVNAHASRTLDSGCGESHTSDSTENHILDDACRFKGTPTRPLGCYHSTVHFTTQFTGTVNALDQGESDYISLAAPVARAIDMDQFDTVDIMNCKRDRK